MRSAFHKVHWWHFSVVVIKIKNSHAIFLQCSKIYSIWLISNWVIHKIQGGRVPKNASCSRCYLHSSRKIHFVSKTFMLDVFWNIVYFCSNCVIDMWNNLCDFMVHSLTVSTFGCSLSIVILSVYNKERDIGTVFLVVYMLTTCLFFHFVLVCIFIIYTYNLSRDCLCSVYCLSYVMWYDMGSFVFVY